LNIIEILSFHRKLVKTLYLLSSIWVVEEKIMPYDSDRCHFCRNWTKEYKRVGDKSICKDCLEELVAIIVEEMES